MNMEMEAIPLKGDLSNIRIGSCISGRTVLVDSPHELEYNTASEHKFHNITPVKKHKHPAAPQRLSAKMSNGLRKSTKNLMESFTKAVSLPAATAEEGCSCAKQTAAHQDRRGSTAAQCMSASDAAELVAAAYFADGSMHEHDDGDFDELFATPSLLDGKQEDDQDDELDESNCTNEQTQGETVTSYSETRSSRSSEPSLEDALALEVGLSAHEYLEECFYTEISVLDRKKFNDIPEITKSDFTIRTHLGKGSYSDVFEIVFKNGHLGVKTVGNTIPAPSRRPARARRATSALASSITVATLSRPRPQLCESRPTFAMKCLRPQIRSDVDQFMIGAEDLVHETAILANLSHPNIIKLHGRASGHLTDAFVLNDGYFILLDRLTETLTDRINDWKVDLECLEGPTPKQIEVAHTVANAMCYLHSKSILFRDLKPANVGFDSNGILKIFDLGFAVGLPEKNEHHNPRGLLYDRCGTPRYMAPEVGLSLGYNLPSDVYSFGILLWEMCSLEKPFGHINSAAEFDQSVFREGERPFIDSKWPVLVRELMTKCWEGNPRRRPTMVAVKSMLSSAMENNNEEMFSPSAVQPRRPRNPGRVKTRRLSVMGW